MCVWLIVLGVEWKISTCDCSSLPAGQLQEKVESGEGGGRTEAAGQGVQWSTCVFLTFAFALLLDCTKINFVSYQLLLTASPQSEDVFWMREWNVNGRCS